MPRLIWSPAALADVQRLYRFLASKNIDAAKRATQAIRQGVQVLADHPEIGRAAPEMAPEFREWPIRFGDSGYVALYRYDGEAAILLAIRHQREAGW
jgi:plasmid stabilization system protein ParE